MWSTTFVEPVAPLVLMLPPLVPQEINVLISNSLTSELVLKVFVSFLFSVAKLSCFLILSQVIVALGFSNLTV